MGCGRAPGRWRRDRAAALVKLLAVTPQHRIHREQVVEIFWPRLIRRLPARPCARLSTFARKALGHNDLIATNGDILALAPSADLVIDAETFEAAARAALRQPTPEGCGAAADLYRGQLLPDDLYCDWLDTPRTRAGAAPCRPVARGPAVAAADRGGPQRRTGAMRADAGRARLPATAPRRSGSSTSLRQSLQMEIGLGPRRGRGAV